MAIRDEKKLAIETHDLSFTFQELQGASLKVIDGITFQLHRGEIVAIVGPSGSGKTTFLRLLAGLLAPDSGKVLIAGQAPATRAGACGYVPQGYSLFPWLTVRDNILYGLQFQRTEAPQDIATQLLMATGLTEFGAAYPKALSGGMKQRVALARALAARPEVLLLDEPFSALDLVTRQEVRNYLLSTIEGKDTSVIIVTHDLQEAAYTADRIVFFSSRPTTILADLAVPFQRPRKPELVETTQFFEFGRQLTGIALQ